jgi:S-methylmethionine-dependent homocysteine/selenocysteine methylase
MTYTKPKLPGGHELFLTDGGLETTLLFRDGFDLPHFAAFHLLKDEKGYEAIKDYYRRYLKLAADFKTGFILESPTWRASRDWVEKLHYPPGAVATINETSIRMMTDLREEASERVERILISGCVGPRGDGYHPGLQMTPREVEAYHSEQVGIFSTTPVDLISAITLNYVEEAIGISRAIAAVNIPYVISFTVETDGKLPTGTALGAAITTVDKAVETPPLYYMINCAHPTHFVNELIGGKNEPWIRRIKGIRANASRKSHAELDEATELDPGEPVQLGREYGTLKEIFPHLNVFGGCCGTDEAHVIQIAKEVRLL